MELEMNKDRILESFIKLLIVVWTSIEEVFLLDIFVNNFPNPQTFCESWIFIFHHLMPLPGFKSTTEELQLLEGPF